MADKKKLISRRSLFTAGAGLGAFALTSKSLIAKEENKINRSKKRIESLNKKLSQQLKKDKKRKPKKMSNKQRRAIQKQIKSLKKKLSLKGGNGCKPVVQ